MHKIDWAQKKTLMYNLYGEFHTLVIGDLCASRE